jgi:hypothetical protein
MAAVALHRVVLCSVRACARPRHSAISSTKRPVPSRVPSPAPLHPSHAGCIAIGGLLYHFFAPAGADCSLNISLITLALLLCLALSLITLHPAVSRRLGGPTSRARQRQQKTAGQLPGCRAMAAAGGWGGGAALQA